MKTIVKITASILMLLVVASLQAQKPTKPPKPPKPPKVQHSEHSDNGSSTYSYSVSSSDGDGQNKSTSVSVSISNSEDSYAFRAKFPKGKYNEIKSILSKEMSSNNHSSSNGRDYWISESNGDEVYKINLSSSKLSMYLDKDIASTSLEEKFEALGSTIRIVIVGEQNDAKREAERMQREADRIRRDAERMQREADRMKREADRQTKNVATKYADDARRIAEEARRLADEATGLNIRASHKGAMSSIVRQLLGDSKTLYNSSTKNAFNWTWPDAQKELLNAFKKDNLINTENDVVFIKDQTGIHVNGTHLSKSQVAKYNTILAKYKISKTIYFTFYKTYKHIVLVDDNADLEDVIDDMVFRGFLSSKNKKTRLELNGSTVYLNGNQLSTDKLSAINSILTKNNIIPAPGKILEIIKSGNSKLGYTVNERTHLGTWVMKN